MGEPKNVALRGSTALAVRALNSENGGQTEQDLLSVLTMA